MMDFCFLLHPTLVAEEVSNPETLTYVDKTSPNKSLLFQSKDKETGRLAKWKILRQ